MATIWSTARRPRPAGTSVDKDDADPKGVRSIFQQDYDRLLFSSPVRRLADKTQVWPMDGNDGVRTRLTHSHEVANLARSIGTRIARRGTASFWRADLHDDVQPMLSAIGLAHDLGNPPFGHQGEVAVGRWFRNRSGWIFDRVSNDGEPLDEQEQVREDLRTEFEDFDGNPQTLRVLATLQTSMHRVGLDLSAGTLAASLKYPVGAGRRKTSKRGLFSSRGLFLVS